ncbi:MAG: substrate-binding domain-containing protein [Phycisphaerales bacterium]|nr:MAG: substrate-binding domain-containing protein [Phycisphaerales bacterium]
MFKDFIGVGVPSRPGSRARHLPFHPCMNHEAHQEVARLHLPVAPKCNIHCSYCQRMVDASRMHEICPGLSAVILTPAEALAKTEAFLSQWGDGAVVGIAGPGDPLANEETFETLELIRSQYSRVTLCLCTNGLELPESVPALRRLGLEHLTVTINAVDPDVAERIHSRVRIKRRIIRGIRGARLLIQRQLDGLTAAVDRGMHVKVNTVVIPGVNEFHVETVAREAAARSASIFNLMPLIPRKHTADRSPPSECHIKLLRQRCKKHLPVFDRCKQCRADAEGVPGRPNALPIKREPLMNRRRFLKASGIAMTGTLSAPAIGLAADFRGESLQLWSCGGLAEAFIPANKLYEQRTGCAVSYTGAFAAALGKSLLGNAQTEVFAPRVLELAKRLKTQGKMLRFWPLCFTRYVLVTPKGNPAGIRGIEDLKRPDVRTVLSPGASPPGGEATLGILKKAGVLEAAQKHAVRNGDCVQRDVAAIVNGEGDVAVVEQRITRLPGVVNRVEVIDIPEDFIPGKPVPFVIGIMKWAKNSKLAQDFVDFIRSAEGQAFFSAAGFIPAVSEEGRRLTEKYGVKDA